MGTVWILAAIAAAAAALVFGRGRDERDAPHDRPALRHETDEGLAPGSSNISGGDDTRPSARRSALNSLE